MSHPTKPAADTIDRRNFLKTGVAATIGTAAASAAGASESASDTRQIATRPFGKTGRKLPILAYGGAALPKVWG